MRVVVLVALALAGCASPEQPLRVGEGGATVELPPGWHVTEAGPVGTVIDPVARLVVASSPIRAAESACQTSSYAFADDAVALVLVEWTELHQGEPIDLRPARSTPASLGVARGTHECFRGRSGAAFFGDSGRRFGAYVFSGDRAPGSLVEDVCAVLDSLEVTPAPART